MNKLFNQILWTTEYFVHLWIWSPVNQSYFGNHKPFSVGEKDGYVTAGYGHHEGERRLLLLPTLLIHLIIRPSRWLKACCMATWHAVTPTLLSDESFVFYYQTVNLWGIKKYFKSTFFPVRLPITANSRARHRHENDAICETQAFAALLPSHVRSRRLIKFTLIKMFGKAASALNGCYVFFF